MAVLKLYPYDMRKSRRSNLSRNRNSKERCGCFNVAAQNNLSLLNQSYNPYVNYSLKKKQRWKLLEEVNRNPAAIFDDEDYPEDLQIVVSSRRNRGNDLITSAKSCSQFYHKSSSAVTEVKDSTKRRHKNVNTRSMIGMMDRKHGVWNRDKVEISFLSTCTAVNQPILETEDDSTKTVTKWTKSKRRSRLNNYSKYLTEEDDFYDYRYDDLYDEDDEETILHEDFEYPKPLSEEWQSVSSNEFSDFEVIDDTVTLQFKDQVKLHRRLLHLPDIDLSIDNLKTIFGGSVLFGSAVSDVCAINISDMLGKRVIRQTGSELRSVQAYVILEKIGDHLSVCLNCHVHPDMIPELHPPRLEGKTTIEEIVEECVLECQLKHQSALIIEDRKYVTEVSGFEIPLDESLHIQNTTVESALPPNDFASTFKDQFEKSNSQCGICFDDLRSGHFSVLRECSHAFCETCWRQHLLSQISVGRRVLSCPAVGCQQAVDLVTKLHHLSLNILLSHHHREISAVLESHNDFVWCPNSNCSRPMRLIGYSKHRQTSLSLPVNIWCSCNVSFCPDCRQEAHWPASCDTYRAYATDLQERGGWTLDWSLSDHTPIRILTKSCPECSMAWQKNGGCNDMDCSVCSQNFCWHCGIIRSDHDSSYPCDSDYAPHKQMKPTETIILPELTSIHLRQMAVANSISNLRSRYFRLVKRAITNNGDSNVNHSDIETKIVSFFRALSECAQISQFAKVAAMAEENSERQEILHACSKTFEHLSVSALRALKDLMAVELPKTRIEALTRLSDCQTEGYKASRDLVTYFDTTMRESN